LLALWFLVTVRSATASMAPSSVTHPNHVPALDCGRRKWNCDSVPMLERAITAVRLSATACEVSRTCREIFPSGAVDGDKQPGVCRDSLARRLRRSGSFRAAAHRQWYRDCVQWNV